MLRFNAFFSLLLLHGTVPPLPPVTPEAPLVVSKKSVKVKPQRPSLAKIIKPLADLIGSGEGSWNSVNRGGAGDTPGGARSVIGKNLTQLTLRELQRYQFNGRLFAVGKYQFLPQTLRLAIRQSGIDQDSLFTPETQDYLLATVLKHKRPAVASFIEGKSVNIDYALDELSREWSSISWRNGRSYYGGIASVSRREARKTLANTRSEFLLQEQEAA